MQQIFKTYQRRLLNLSSSNRSLLLLRPAASLHFDLHQLDYLQKDSSFSIIKNLVAGKNKTLLPVSDSRHAPNYGLSRQLVQLSRKEKLIWEERGARELYTGWPFVQGCLAGNVFVRCPLLFFPVKLVVNSKQEWELQPDQNRQPHFNKSFLLAYAHYLQIPPDENLLDLDVSELPADITAFRTELYALLKSSSLQINFNQDLFTDTLQHFKSYRKDEFEKIWQPGQLKLLPEAVTGIFPQAASYLQSDYDELLENTELSSLETLFENNSGHTNKEILEQQVYSVLEMDASQEAALEAVKKGKSVVVQGPPGTGKSQMICNLASDFMARGKKVLIVCQKRAALDVVHKRLSAKNLGDFTALVHDIHADRKQVFSQLNNQIESVHAYKKQDTDFTNISLDRQYIQTSKQIDKITTELDEFKTALFNDTICGWPVKELYLRSNLQAQKLDIHKIYRQVTSENLPQVLPQVDELLHYQEQLKPADFWQNRKNFQHYNQQTKQDLEQLITRFSTEISKLAEKIASNDLELSEKWKLLHSLVPEVNHINNNLAIISAPRVKLFFKSISENKLKVNQILKDVKNLKLLLTKTELPKAVHTHQKLAHALKLIQVFHKKNKSLKNRLNWHLFSGEKKQLQQLLEQNNLAFTEDNCKVFAQLLSDKSKVIQAASEIYTKLHFNTPELTDSVELLFADLEKLQKAIEAKIYFNALQKRFTLLFGKDKYQHYPPEKYQNIVAVTEAFQVLKSGWDIYFTQQQLEQLASSEKNAAKAVSQLNQYFEYLVAADSKWMQATTLEKSIFEKVETINTSSDQALEIFQNNLFLSWINHIEEKFPVLRIVSNGQMEMLEKQLQQLVLTKQALSEQIVQLRVRENTYSDLQINRLGNRVTYRKLQAQVQKKRQLYPLRKLISLFGNEIFNLVPCWLASPETVSALFSLHTSFDLVIFDEASQCFAEQGLPAIFRGKQIVITGDSKQLRPSDLYRVRWQTEEDEQEELAVESLLDLGNLYLEQHMLTEHYRSRYPELIAFSNKHFYNQKLQLIPDKELANQHQPALQFHAVSGTWENNSNLPEAEFVVKEVLKLVRENKVDIGVITFNYAQQQLIQDLLEEAFFEIQLNIPEGISVKNIENIQGDEKQVIILTTAYAPDKNGKVKLQFGSLNTESGENRLNVAITRAKEKMIVVSSLLSGQLATENAKHKGPKLLRAFLEYASIVSAGNFNTEPISLPVSVHGYLLKNVICEESVKNNAVQVVKALPFADLTVKQNNSYLKVVMTDDDLYFAQKSAKHNHAGLPYRLESHHWPFKRFYSRQWWLNPQQITAQLT